MPAITVDDPLVLPRLEWSGVHSGVSRSVIQVVTAQQQSEGVGF